MKKNMGGLGTMMNFYQRGYCIEDTLRRRQCRREFDIGSLTYPVSPHLIIADQWGNKTGI